MSEIDGMRLIERCWLAYWDEPTRGPAVSPVVARSEKQAEDYADAGFRVESFVSTDAYLGAVSLLDDLADALTRVTGAEPPERAEIEALLLRAARHANGRQ